MVKLIRGFYTYIRLFFFNGDMSILPDLTGPNLKTGTESRPCLDNGGLGYFHHVTHVVGSTYG